MIFDQLKELGLSEGQIAVYSAVLELGTGSLNSIQEKTGIERRNIYDILNKLIEKGYISYIEEQKRRVYQCTHPNKNKEEIYTKQEALEKLEKQMPQIKELFNVSKPEVRAEVYRGNEAIKAFLEEALNYPDSHWMGGNSGIEQRAGGDMKRWFAHWMQRRIEKGHIMHDLVDNGTYLEGLEPEKIEMHKKNLYKYCELPKDFSSPLVMVMYGNKLAQIVWSEKSFAFVLEYDEIKEAYMKYFNYFWKDPW